MNDVTTKTKPAKAPDPVKDAVSKSQHGERFLTPLPQGAEGIAGSKDHGDV